MVQDLGAGVQPSCIAVPSSTKVREEKREDSSFYSMNNSCTSLFWGHCHMLGTHKGSGRL